MRILRGAIAAAALCALRAASAIQAGAAERWAPPLDLAIHSDRAFYSILDSATIYLSVTPRAPCEGLLYVAALAPDGRCLFYSVERNLLVQGDPFRMETWTPFDTRPVFFSPAQTVKDLEIRRGRLPAGSFAICGVIANPSPESILSGVGVARISVFPRRIGIVGGAVHVGDSRENYMLGWESPDPAGTSVSARFRLGSIPADPVLQGAYFGTYFPTNRVYLNGRLLAYLPGAMNANAWHRAAAPVPPGFLRPGINTLTFESFLRSDGRYDDYMVKSVELLYH